MNFTRKTIVDDLFVKIEAVLSKDNQSIGLVKYPKRQLNDLDKLLAYAVMNFSRDEFRKLERYVKEEFDGRE